MQKWIVLLLVAGIAQRSDAQVSSDTGLAVFYGERSTVIVTVPARGPNGDLLPRQLALVQSCNGARLAVPSSAEAQSLESASERERGGLLHFTVLPNPPGEAVCDGRWSPSATADLRGDRELGDTALLTGVSPRSVRVTLGDRPIDALRADRQPLLWLPPDVVQPTELFSNSFSLRMDDVVPSRAGAARALSVAVTMEGGGAPDVIVIPWEPLRSLWQAALVPRVATLSRAVPVVSLPAPSDSGLRKATAELAGGDVAVDAMLYVLRRAHSYELSQADRTWARAQSVLALDQVGDTLGLRVMTTALLSEEPCFRWRADAPASVREMAQRLEMTGARCTAASLWQVAGRAVVAPGFARPALRDGRSRAGVKFTAVVLGALLVGQWQNREALDRYEAYKSAQIIVVDGPTFPLPAQPDVVSLYTSADNARLRALGATAIGVGLWAVHGALELLAERKFRARLSEISATGIGPSGREMGWRPALSVVPGGVAFSVRHAW